MVKKEMIKQAYVAGAGTALKYKEQNPRATESEVMSHVTKEMQKLLRNIEDNE